MMTSRVFTFGYFTSYTLTSVSMHILHTGITRCLLHSHGQKYWYCVLKDTFDLDVFRDKILCF